MKPNKKNKRNSHWCCCFHLSYRYSWYLVSSQKPFQFLVGGECFFFFCSFFYYCCCMFAFVFVLNTREFFWLCHDLEYVIYIIRNKNRQFLWVFHTKCIDDWSILSSLLFFLLNDFGDNIYCKRLLRSIANWKHTKTRKKNHRNQNINVKHNLRGKKHEKACISVFTIHDGDNIFISAENTQQKNRRSVIK